jgi:NAD(P)H dehydrogenase (quinone)
MKALVLFYSMYGHIHQMARAMAEGVSSVEGAEVTLERVPETLPQDVLEKMGALDPTEAWPDVAVAERGDMADYDLICVGTPTRFGNMCGQMRQYFDGTGGLWAEGKLIGKVATVFTSTATQHGGQESTILSTHITLLHQGMVIVGLPYSFSGQTTLDEITGCSPYGASTIAAGDGSRQPSANELDGARFQGAHAAKIATKLFG